MLCYRILFLITPVAAKVHAAVDSVSIGLLNSSVLLQVCQQTP
jgi:hypothetical protein